ncbi:MAG TPA: homocysteine S-methyltransferase family protein [Acidobacteriota bacterium]|jgi:S-methylmethionine-dependent homocysteine/selenocysteine methylase
MAESPYQAIKEKLLSREMVVLDGGIGTEIVRRGVRWRQLGLRTDADKVQQIHEDYIAAGADVISTDTFQLTRRLFLNLFHNIDHMRRIGREGLEHQAEELTGRAVKIAKQARQAGAQGRPVAIAGSIAPLEHCFRPDLSPPYAVARKEHADTAKLLAQSGVDLLLVETMNTSTEARAALEAALETKLPVWVSFVLGPDGNVLSGESLAEAVTAIEQMKPDAILVNCAPPDDILKGVETLAELCALPFGAYAHIGHYDPPSWKFEFHPQFCDVEGWPPQRYAEQALKWRDRGATIIGGCCGTGPEHIRLLKKTLVEKSEA